jgi:tetratricopeptide (TPR) repeat protein
MERPNSPFVEDLFQMLSCAAVAAAMAGQYEEASRLVERALAQGEFAEALVNRGALRAQSGDLRGAEADLRRALELSPRLPSAVRNLATVFTRQGEAEAGARELLRAEELALAAPRGFPYGIGNGIGLGSRRFTLILDGDRLTLYQPARKRVGER